MRAFTRRISLIAAAALLAPALVSSPAHAQLGGALKKIKQKAEDAAAQKAGLGEAGPTPRTPVASPNLVKIDAGSLDQLLKGMQAELAEVQRRQADSVAYEQRKAAWDRCESDQTAKEQKLKADFRKNGDPYEAMAQRAAAAAQRGDMKAMQAISDSLTKAMGAAHAKMAAQVGPGCGENPSNAFERLGQADVRNAVATVAARAAGLEPKQYALLRERVAHWALVDGKVGPGLWAYWPEELTAMSARRDELLKHAGYFRDSYAESMWGVKG